jgi:phage terminase large subunit-like protein
LTDALRLRLRPHDVQRAFLTSTDQTRLFVGGLGSGKTFAGWVAALMLPPDAGLGLIMAPTYPMIRDVLIASLETHFRPFVSDINKTEHRVTFVNGMTCLLRSATDPDKMRGINAGWGWAEEACFIGHDAMTVWASRIRVGAERKWVTTTPIKGVLRPSGLRRAGSAVRPVHVPIGSQPALVGVLHRGAAGADEREGAGTGA